MSPRPLEPLLEDLKKLQHPGHHHATPVVGVPVLSLAPSLLPTGPLLPKPAAPGLSLYSQPAASLYTSTPYIPVAMPSLLTPAAGAAPSLGGASAVRPVAAASRLPGRGPEPPFSATSSAAGPSGKDEMVASQANEFDVLGTADINEDEEERQMLAGMEGRGGMEIDETPVIDRACCDVRRRVALAATTSKVTADVPSMLAFALDVRRFAYFLSCS